MKKIIFSTIIISVFMLSVSCSNTDNDETFNKSELTEINLTQEEISDLIFLREEEKLARDVYLNFYEKYNLQIFKNISNSESQHMSTVLKLLNKYDIEDPASPNIGVFHNTDLQKIYNDLIAQSNISLVEALKVGNKIEDLDISDLTLNESRTYNVDILSVYGTLKCGSRNHLRNFNALLLQNNDFYEPLFLTQDEFDAIVSTTNEKCNLN
jgi:hypothetical protein